jgi:hypothetical protein
MRTTLDIDDELLLTVKQIAHQRKTTAGSVVSSLLRESLQPTSFRPEYRNGIPLLPRRPNAPSLRLANASHGRLITFDRTIRWQWVTGCGPGALEVLPGESAA